MALDQPTTALGVGYWRMWSSAAMSNLADGTLKIALPLVALGYTRSPAQIAGLAFAFTLPWLICALPAGAIADRQDRRWLMLGANVARTVLVAALVVVVLLHGGSIWALYVIALGVGFAETFYDTASQSIVPQLVRRDQLPRANGRLYAAELTANEFAGPPLAGVLVAAGAIVAFTAPVLLWIVALAALQLLRGSFKIERHSDRRTSLGADIAEGVRYLWRNRILRLFAVTVGVFNFTSSATQAVLVLYAVGSTSAMGLSEPAFGWLLSSFALGSLAGSFLAEPVVRALGRARALLLSFAVSALVIGLPAVVTNAVLAGTAFALSGAAIIISNVVMVSLRQTITPDRLLGRVNSGHRLVAWGTKPLGAAAGGVLAQLLGLRVVFVVMGLLALASTAALARLTDSDMRAAEARVAETGG